MRSTAAGHPALVGLAELVLLAAGLLGVGCAVQPRTPAGWERVFPAFRAPVYELVRDPAEPDVLYAACGRQSVSSALQIGGVLRSVDGGRRWVEASRGIPQGVEVLALALASPAAAGDPPTLLAATVRAGLYASNDGGESWRALGQSLGQPDWSRMSLQTVAVAPGTGAQTVVAGSRGQGVLVSLDGGESWQLRDQGLLNLTIQSVAFSLSGSLLAATQYGGIYESHDLGLSWRSLGAAYERLTIATLEPDAAGALWVGLQNAGLLMRPAPGEDFRQAGLSADQAIGVLAIATSGDRLALGTDTRGVLLGRRDGELVGSEQGLENQTVLAVSIDPRPEGDLVIGTWDGLFRSLPPRSQAMPLGLLLGLGALGLAALALARHRSTAATTARIYRTLGGLEGDALLGAFLASEVHRLAPERMARALAQLARRLGRAGEDPRARLAGVARASAMLASCLEREENLGEGAANTQLAQLLRNRAQAIELLAPQAPAARQDHLLAAVLEIENLSQLAPLRTQLEPLIEPAETAPGSGLDPLLLSLLARVLGTLEPLHRLPMDEEHALFLGQALDQTLKAQTRLAARDATQQSHVTKLGMLALETLRKLLSSSLRSSQQRAELQVELRSRELAVRHKATVMIEVRNVGRGHALDIEAELLPSEGLRLIEAHTGAKSLLRNQALQLEFLVEPQTAPGQGRVRLRFRLTYDDLDRRGHVLEFADVAQLRELDPRVSFRALRPNPYVVGRPLGRADFFIGRSELFSLIADALQGASQDNVVVLIGQRRMGKTSVLRRLPHVLGDRYAPVLVDLQGLLGSGEASFLYELAALIHDELLAAGFAVEEPARNDFNSEPGFAFRRRFLPAVTRALGQRRLLLLFDEFEVLEERILTGELPPRILPYLRSLMQHEEKVSFMFAGTHRLDELTRDYWSVLFNLAVYLDVGYLSKAEVSELFVEPTQGYFEIDPLALEKVHAITGGHPHLSQLLARELVSYRNQHLLSYVTVQDVRRVAITVIERGHLHVAYLWEEAQRVERLLLLAVKDLLDRDGLATLETAFQHLNEQRIAVGDLPAALRSLLRREILVSEGGLLGFRMGLLPLWLERHHSLASQSLSDTGEIVIGA